MKTIAYFFFKFQKYLFGSSVDNKSALVRIMAWCRTGDKTLPEPMLTNSMMPYGVTKLSWVNTPFVVNIEQSL